MKRTVNFGSKGVATPYDFTDEEFREEIRKAERGKFYPIENLRKEMKVWMEQQKKK